MNQFFFFFNLFLLFSKCYTNFVCQSALNKKELNNSFKIYDNSLVLCLVNLVNKCLINKSIVNVIEYN